jgi:hypothetical protein
MPKQIRVIKILILTVSVILITSSGCVVSKKQYVYSKKNESLCDLSRLGKNKFFYSAYYQRKLRHNIKMFK